MEVFIVLKQYALNNPSILNESDAHIVFLSDDYQSYVKLRANLSSEKNLERLGNRFHEKLEEIKKEFLKLSSNINELNNFNSFWGTLIASRNSASTYLLKDIIYAICARDMMIQSSFLILIVDRLSLAETLDNLAQSTGFQSKIFSTFRDKLCFSKTIALMPIRIFYFFTINLTSIFFSKFLKNRRISQSNEKEKTLLVSWITAGSINDQSQYIERNFGPLKDFLTKKNREVWILPLCFNLDRPYLKQLKLMSQSDIQFLFPEQYLNVWDILCVIVGEIRNLRLKWPSMKIQGCDVSKIIKWEAFTHAFGISLLKFNLIYSLFKKLSQTKKELISIIYPFENNPVEKILIRATKFFLPQTHLIGFQHSVWYKEQLGMELSLKESVFHPLPNKIVCSGSSYMEILKNLHFPQTLLTCGPSLRFLDIHKNSFKEWESSKETKKILIILNFDMNQCMEILDKLNQVLKSVKKITISIKSHPLLNKKYLSEYLSSIHFQEYTWVDGRVSALANLSDVVIMPYGSVSNLETIAIGTPLIRIHLENDFNFDPLWESEFSFGDAKSVPELIFILNKALHLNENDKVKLRANAMAMRNKYFQIYSDKAMEVFL